MTSVTLTEAQARLPELIEKLVPDEELVITRDSSPIARLVAERRHQYKDRQPGAGKGRILFMADDFDAPLDDFKEYMQ